MADAGNSEIRSGEELINQIDLVEDQLFDLNIPRERFEKTWGNERLTEFLEAKQEQLQNRKKFLEVKE